MNTRSNDVETGIKVNRVVPLWGIILIIGTGIGSAVQMHNAQEKLSEQNERLEKSILALTVKLDALVERQISSKSKDDEHDFKLSNLKDQMDNMRTRMTNIESVLPRQYPQQAPQQVIIQQPTAPAPKGKQ